MGRDSIIEPRLYKITNGASFYNRDQYDFASAIHDKEILKTFFMSGLSDVANIVQKELNDRKLLGSLFIEMNFIGTLLETKEPNILNSLVYIREGIKPKDGLSMTPNFADNIQHYSNALTKALNRKYGFSLLFHPDIFIDIKEPSVPYSIIAPHAKTKATLDELEDPKFKKGVDAGAKEEESRKTLQYLDLGIMEGFNMDSDPGSWIGGKAKIVLGNSRIKNDYRGIIDVAKSIREGKIDFNNNKDLRDVRTALHEFHRYYHNYYAHKHHTVYMSIPIHGAYSSNTLYSVSDEGKPGQGVIFLFFTIPSDSNIYEPRYDENGQKLIKAIESLAECLYERLGSMMRFLTYNYLFNIGVNLAENANKKAINSAVSAIMSRNMSHNLGSHYLYYTKNYLMDLANNGGEKNADIRGAAKVLGYMQARMDYLATVISNDRYPNGAVNFKSQIFDELTVDSFSKRHFSKYVDRGKRTTNFLLTNLVKSENFTRPNIFTRNSDLENDRMRERFKQIRLQVKLWDGSKYVLFTGEANDKALIEEKEIKNELSKLNIALPGGAMSCHAFFNVIENFIRNSAKYLQSDFKEEGLIFTIAIKKNEDDNHYFDLIIYDNKNNASKVLPVVLEQLQNLKILDENGDIEKSSKGLKEMLFSSVWMRTYKYPLLTFADIITHIQNTGVGDEKLQLIEEYGFKFVSISDSGEILDKNSSKGNLGLLITLPEFIIATDFALDDSDEEKDIIAKALGVSSDIVCFGSDLEKLKEKDQRLLSYFTRSFFETDFDEENYKLFCEKARVIAPDDYAARMVYRFKKILDRRFFEKTNGDIDNMCLMLGDRKDMKRVPKDHNMIIYFERHLNTKKGLDAYTDYAYADTISGGNYTITLNSLVNEGITADTCRYKTWYDKLYGLKIKESALTRITLIDERLFNSMKRDGAHKELEYSMKNIRILSMDTGQLFSPNKSLIDLFEGNAFQDGSNQTHFLSIHLGLIEKIAKSEWGKRYGTSTKLEDRVTAFMDEMKKMFGGTDGNVFISVHSGRGNYSKELDGPLATYAFISLAAIENAFSNSKYLLSQLFYNTIYIGKGIINRYL